MILKKLYFNKTDIGIMALFSGGFVGLALAVSIFLPEKYSMVVLFILIVVTLQIFIMYTYKRHLAYRIYDANEKHNYKQIEALFNIFSMYKFQYPLPEMRHWAVSPDALLYLLRQAIKDRAETIVECGSGVSTIVLAKCMKEKGSGHVYSLDHDEYYAEKTREALKLHGVEDYATVITAPLAEVQINGKGYKWYEADKVNALPGNVDLVFVDGPPAPEGSYNRYPALYMLKDKMSPNCRIMMDDVVRADEEDISRKWAAELGRLDVTYFNVEKKMALI